MSVFKILKAAPFFRLGWAEMKAWLSMASRNGSFSDLSRGCCIST
jgi:hypothetical protein